MRKLFFILILVTIGLWFSYPQLFDGLAPHIVQKSEQQQFNDMLIDMEPDAAIQAGYIQTIHEQRWSNEAFLSLFGMEIPLGKTGATLRAPIKVYYGVKPAAVHATQSKNGQLHLTVERVEVLSVDADISKLEIKTDVGWARLDAVSGKEARERAKLAFEKSKRRAVDNMLQSMQVTAYLRDALRTIATQISGITDVRIERRDLPEALNTK